MSIIRNLIRKKIQPETKVPTALCCFYDGRFDSELANLGLKLIGCKDHSVYDWPTNAKSPNIQLIEEYQIPDYEYDFIICNDIIKQRPHILKFTRLLHLPGLVINHEPFMETNYHLNKRLQEAKVDIVSTEPHIENAIKHGTTELEGIEKDIPVLLEGNFQQNDYRVLQSLHAAIPDMIVLGHNPGLDFSISPNSYEEYRQYFARCQTFINLPTQGSISHQLLWAMSNGASIVSLQVPILEELLKDRGIFCRHPSEIPAAVKIAKTNTKIQNKAKEVNNLFSIQDFRDKWQTVIQDYTRRIYAQ